MLVMQLLGAFEMANSVASIGWDDTDTSIGELMEKNLMAVLLI